MEQYLLETPVASVIFIFTVITSLYAFSNPGIYDKFMLNPYAITRGERIYAVITSGLIHADWGHLFFNMMSFYFFAFTLERTIGHWQFAVLYLASLALSDISTIVRHKNDSWYNSLGASGAISAVVFSFIIINPLVPMGIIFLPIQIPAVLFGVLYLIYSAYASKQSSHINHDAHFYGALSGIIITIIFYPQVIASFFQQLSGSRI